MHLCIECGTHRSATHKTHLSSRAKIQHRNRFHITFRAAVYRHHCYVPQRPASWHAWQIWQLVSASFQGLPLRRARMLSSPENGWSGVCSPLRHSGSTVGCWCIPQLSVPLCHTSDNSKSTFRQQSAASCPYPWQQKHLMAYTLFLTLQETNQP